MNPEINIGNIKTALGKIITEFQPPVRGKLRVLIPFKPEIFALREKGATPAEIAALLAQFEIIVSKDSVARFIRLQRTADKQAKRTRTHETRTNPEPSAAALPRTDTLQPRRPGATTNPSL